MMVTLIFELRTAYYDRFTAIIGDFYPRDIFGLVVFDLDAKKLVILFFNK